MAIYIKPLEMALSYHFRALVLVTNNDPVLNLEPVVLFDCGLSSST